MPIGREPIEKGSIIGKMENGEQTSDKVAKSRKESFPKIEFQYSDPIYSFDDIIISNDIRNAIEDSLSIFKYQKILFDQWKLSRVFKRNNSILINFYGAPGTGKTMAANAVATELGMKILWVNYADIESKYVGETSKNITYMFSEAKRQGAIIVFDEADALLSKRVTDMSSATDVSVNQTRSVLLHLLDEYEGVVIFTTNFIRNYDPAFMRRIPYHIKFDLPNEEFRKKIYQHYLTCTVPHSVDFDDMAQKFEGISGSDISNAIMMAAVKTAREGLNIMPQGYLEESICRVIQGKKDNQDMTSVRVYERNVSEEYALEQIKRRGNNL